MTLQLRDWTIIPEQTAQIARAAFPKENIYMKRRDELGVIYATAAAINLSRLFDWLRAVPRSQTRQSRFAALEPLPQDNLSFQALECGA